MTSGNSKPDITANEALPTLTLPLYAMNGGDGPHSYVQNSSYQRGVVDIAKPIIEEEISKNVDIKVLSSASTNGFWVADFGCSTGHNSFPAMQIITEAIHQKHAASSGLITPKVPKFVVVFNDVITNDFNTLFSSLPPHRNYNAVGVPGDFHARLLPESSLLFAYSSWALHWLTEVPKVVGESGSRAWNKGEILYTKDRKDVCDAYLNQYAKDIEAFLDAREVEMMSGGLMTLLIPAVPAFWNPDTEYTYPSDVNLLGSCLMDMAKKGRFCEAKVDSFNLPYYFPTPEQLKPILERSHSFSLERLEILNNPGKHSLPSVKARAAFIRAVHEGLLADHFGSEVIDELFDLYIQKLAASPVFQNPNNDKSIVILAVLKRKSD
ncbi:probable S-adenosylmethionine-dependent methyltransferase At5g37990 [Sesamum indicum]|uniref:Probable S-adenosylmethionine-dependent methyltransferase At5g37990 n=1 Tax=Sesamum indicum TaxID=4182 RepID=A0A6I9SJJ6_SESIN|nr:probable S-adenosylmethionine-dependent methyltransferase At5g37990 [Sesamum indicum]